MRKFDKKMVRSIRESLQEAIKGVEEKHKIGLTVGSATFDAASFRISLEGIILDDGETKESAEWNRLAPKYGFDSSDLGREVTVRGNSYTLFGLNERAIKYPVIVKSLKNGELYKSTVEDVKFKV